MKEKVKPQVEFTGSKAFTPKIYHKILAVLLALLLWQIGAIVINNQILLVTPIQVGNRLFSLVLEKGFWFSVGFSLCRIALGFFLSLIIGIALAVASYCFKVVQLLLWPFIAVIKSTPVASIVILCLIWVSGTNLSVLISFLMVLPIVYTNVLQGINLADNKLLVMADFFKFGALRKAAMIYMPAVKPYILSACGAGLGLAWKAGISAEIIGIPTGSMGEKLYEAKYYLNTPDIFAWTVVIIAVSVIFEKLVLYALGKVFKGKINFSQRPYIGAVPAFEVDLKNISVSFGSKKVLENFTHKFSGTTAIMGKSGCGKTTLINVILGLVNPISGQVINKTREIAPMFQEDRLCSDFTALENLIAAKGISKEMAANALSALQLVNSAAPVSEFSGGMKRRVALARAMLAPASLIILDEPFKGLDEKTKQAAISFVKNNIRGRCIIVITHQEEEARQLGGEILFLNTLQYEE